MYALGCMLAVKKISMDNTRPPGGYSCFRHHFGEGDLTGEM